jgi:hypothetical protein
LTLEIWLCEKEPPAAAISATRGAMEVSALSSQALFWPQPPFTNNSFHALKPAGHGRVIVGKVKRLRITGGKLAVAHAVATWMVYPALLWG